MNEQDVESSFRERAARMVDAGMSDRDIDQAIMYSDHADRVRIWHYVNERRGTEAPIRPVPATPLQREKIPLIPGIVRKLRRSNTHGATKVSVAAALEISRDTLDDWIAAGLVRWPPAE